MPVCRVDLENGGFENAPEPYHAVGRIAKNFEKCKPSHQKVIIGLCLQTSYDCGSQQSYDVACDV